MSLSMTPAQRVALEPVDKLIDVLKERCSWTLMKRVLATRNLKPGVGWVGLKTRVANGDNDSQVIATLVQQTYVGSLVAGDRYVQLYELDASLASPVVARLASASVPPSPFTARYPLPLVSPALDTAPTQFTLCEINQQGADWQLVFCSQRVIEDSLVIDGRTTPTVMNTFKQALSGYDKFVAYKRQPVQVFDVVSIRPRLGRLEVALDITQKTTDFDAEDLALKLLMHVSFLVPDLQTLVHGQYGFNLFPAISEIYKSPARADTVIEDIGFRTPSGAVNRGKTHSSDEDIRDEAFHKSGSEAVQKKINPHGVVVNWTFTFPNGGCTVKLWTTAAKAMVQTPHLTGAVINDAAADSDIVQALNKVTSFL